MIADFFRALKSGHELASAEAWKRTQIRTGLLVTFITAALGIAKAFGYESNLSQEEVQGIAITAGLVGGLLLSVGTAVSSKRVGLSTSRSPELPGGPDGVRGDSPDKPDNAPPDRPAGLDDRSEGSLLDMSYKG